MSVFNDQWLILVPGTNRWEKVPLIITQLAIYTTYIYVLMGWIWPNTISPTGSIDFPERSRGVLTKPPFGGPKLVWGRYNLTRWMIFCPTLFWMISLFLPTQFVVSKCFFNKVCVYLSCAHTKPKSLQGGGGICHHQKLHNFTEFLRNRFGKLGT